MLKFSGFSGIYQVVTNGDLLWTANRDQISIDAITNSSRGFAVNHGYILPLILSNLVAGLAREMRSQSKL